jgi:hypothetical protein
MLIDFEKVRPGQVVRFEYAGGQGNGPRLVEVKDGDSTYLRGTDRQKNEYRQYRRDRIVGSVELVAQPHEEVIQPSTFLLDPNVPIERACEAYKSLNPDRASGVSVNTNAKVLVVKRTDIPRVDITVQNKTIRLDFLNSEGERVGVQINHEHVVNHEMVFSCPMNQADFYTFASNFERMARKNPSVGPSFSGTTVAAPNVLTGNYASVRPATWEDKLVGNKLVGSSG